jgi:putative protein-disulfide isomerase
MTSTLYYIHDPMCSWCWGYKPVWNALEKALPMDIKVEYVAGGLAADSNEPMPIAQQSMIKAHWKTIEEKLGTKFNYDFWQNNVARRSTYNACRAVIAAKTQNAEQEMLFAIQKGYYLRALNPSDNEMLIQFAQELIAEGVNINLNQFVNELTSDTTQQELLRQIQLSRQLSIHGFPSLVLESAGQRHFIKHDYKNHLPTLAKIMNYLK